MLKNLRNLVFGKRFFRFEVFFRFLRVFFQILMYKLDRAQILRLMENVVYFTHPCIIILALAISPIATRRGVVCRPSVTYSCILLKLFDRFGCHLTCWYI